MKSTNPYTQMQQRHYETEAAFWSPENRNPVVGAFDAHNAWPDYDLLFKGLDTEDKVALDFGCGPGRSLVRFQHRFRRIDGVDISAVNLENARRWCECFGVAPPVLFQNDGISLTGIASNTYDIVFSTICLQHICVHSIRLNLMREFVRVLCPGGWFTAQMGYGPSRPESVAYHTDNMDAAGSNGACDTRVEAPEQLRVDLEAVGLESFGYILRPTGPGDLHDQWIFFRAQKPFKEMQ